MIHTGDTIEEVTTKRQGKVRTGGTFANGQEVVSRWLVQFSDGEHPLIKDFFNDADIRLITCPHTSEPGCYPAESIIGQY